MCKPCLISASSYIFNSKPYLHALLKTRWVCSIVGLALWAAPYAQARELPLVDALGEAPLALQSKVAVATPDRVEKLHREERLGIPTFVQLRPGNAPPVSLKGALAPESAARAEFKALASLYGITSEEVEAAPLHDVQVLPNGGKLVRLAHQKDGIEIFREYATVLLDAQSRATAVGGYLGSTAAAPTTKATVGRLDAVDAVARALEDWGFDPGLAQRLRKEHHPERAASGAYSWWNLPPGEVGSHGATLVQPARTKPVWFRLPQGLVRASYVEVRVLEEGEEHA